MKQFKLTIQEADVEAINEAWEVYGESVDAGELYVTWTDELEQVAEKLIAGEAILRPSGLIPIPDPAWQSDLAKITIEAV